MRVSKTRKTQSVQNVLFFKALDNDASRVHSDNTIVAVPILKLGSELKHPKLKALCNGAALSYLFGKDKVTLEPGRGLKPELVDIGMACALPRKFFCQVYTEQNVV